MIGEGSGPAHEKAHPRPKGAAVIAMITGLAAATASCGAASVAGSGLGIEQAVYFRPVYCVLPFVASNGLPPAPGPLSAASCSSGRVEDYAATPPGGDTPGATVLVPDLNRDGRFVLGPADLGSSDLVGAWVQSSGSGFGAVVGFTAAGAARFDRVAATRYAVYEKTPSSPAAAEAIDVNGEVVSFARMTSSDDGGCVEILGAKGRGLSNTDASNLVDEIRAAAHLQSQPSVTGCSGASPSFTFVNRIVPAGHGSLDSPSHRERTPL